MRVSPILIGLFGCAPSDSRPIPVAAEIQIDLVAPDGTEELVSTAASSVYPSGSFKSFEGLHAVLDVEGSDCVTATTLHFLYDDPLTFTTHGAQFSPDHRFAFVTVDASSGEGRARALYGGGLTVITQDASVLELQIEAGTYCPDFGTEQLCAPQTSPFWMRLEGPWVVPRPVDPADVFADPEVFDPSTGDPLCAAERGTYTGGP